MQRDTIVSKDENQGIVFNGVEHPDWELEDAIDSLIEMYDVEDTMGLQVEVEHTNADGECEKLVICHKNSGIIDVDMVDEFPSEIDDDRIHDTSSLEGFSSGVSVNPLATSHESIEDMDRRIDKIERRKKGISRKTVAGVAVGVLLLGGIGTTATVNAISSPDNQEEQAAVPIEDQTSGSTSNEPIQTTLSQTIDGASEQVSNGAPPQYSVQQWSYSVPKGAQMSNSTVAMSYKTNKQVVLVDTNTGKNIRSINIKSSVTRISDAYVDGKQSVVWQDGNVFHVWNPDVGAKKDIPSFDIPKGASVSNSGELVKASTKSTSYALTMKGFSEYKAPKDAVPLSIDRDGMISSASAQGPVYSTSQDGSGDPHELDAPNGNAYINRWISTGYGKTITVWSNTDSQLTDNDNVVLAVHDAKTGKLLSSFGTRYGDVNEDNGKWMIGSGKKLATIANRVFDLESGKIILDGTSIGAKINSIKGTFISGKDSKGPFIARQDMHAWRGNSPVILSTDQSMLCIEQKGNKVNSYVTSESALA